jgi:excisionase family DNA binding protein
MAQNTETSEREQGIQPSVLDLILGLPHRRKTEELKLEERFYLPLEVAELLCLSMEQVADLLRTGELPAVKVSRRWRIPYTGLRDFLEACLHHPSPTDRLLLLAREVVGKVLEAGLQEGHEPESWRKEPASFHALKGIRHATTALLQLLHPDLPSRSEEGLEEHLERAVCRLVMALARVRGEGQRSDG